MALSGEQICSWARTDLRRYLMPSIANNRRLVEPVLDSLLNDSLEIVVPGILTRSAIQLLFKELDVGNAIYFSGHPFSSLENSHLNIRSNSGSENIVLGINLAAEHGFWTAPRVRGNEFPVVNFPGCLDYFPGWEQYMGIDTESLPLSVNIVRRMWSEEPSLQTHLRLYLEETAKMYHEQGFSEDGVQLCKQFWARSSNGFLIIKALEDL